MVPRPRRPDAGRSRRGRLLRAQHAEVRAHPDLLAARVSALVAVVPARDAAIRSARRSGCAASSPRTSAFRDATSSSPVITCRTRPRPFSPRPLATRRYSRPTASASGRHSPSGAASAAPAARPRCQLTREIRFPHSLGLLYSTFTAYLGFPVNEGEYKVMGLAAYGRPTLCEAVRKVIRRTPDGGFALGRSTSSTRRARAGRSPRRSSTSSARRAIRTTRSTSRATRDGASPTSPRACSGCSKTRCSTSRARCAGRPGCRTCASAAASPSTASPTRGILAESGFERVFVPPAPGDAGCAVGAALYADRVYFGNPDRDVPDHPFMGPSVDADELARVAREDGQHVEALDETTLLERVADDLAAGRVVGWMDGATEFGPRALGHRSILAAPHAAEMRDRLNRDIKSREEFRPFAPVVRAEDAERYFELPPGGLRLARFMSGVFPVRCEWRAAARRGHPRGRHGPGAGARPRRWRHVSTRCSAPTGGGPAFRCCSTRRSTWQASRS